MSSNSLAVLESTKSSASSLYSALDATKREIRLVTIISPSGSALIECRLDSYTMENAPPYVALSYAWGNPNPRVPIRLNGHDILISPNLYMFLTVFRSYEDHRPIWIDQISIDQTNTSERNSQVQMMDCIYRKSAETACWLGGDPSNGLAFATIQKYQPQKGEDWENAQNRYWNTGSEAERTSTTAISHSPYWNRHWIVQEFVLGTAGLRGTVYFGLTKMMVEELENFWRRISVESQLGLDGKYCPEFSLLNVRLMLAAKGHAIPVTGWMERMHSLFEMASKTVCEDPRDKIYGMQNMFPPSVQIKVDYDERAQDTFLRCLSAWIPMFVQEILIPRWARRTSNSIPAFKVTKQYWFLSALGQLAEGMHLITRGITMMWVKFVPDPENEPDAPTLTKEVFKGMLLSHFGVLFQIRQKLDRLPADELEKLSLREELLARL